MAQYLGQIGTPQPSIADSLNLFAAQQQARKQANMQQALELIKSGLYKPSQQDQQPGLMQRFQNSFLGPQVGGNTMNVNGQNYQYNSNPNPMDAVDLQLKQKQLEKANMTPEQKAQNAMTEMKALQSNVPMGGSASVDSSGGATMSYMPPDQLEIQRKQADIQQKTQEIKNLQSNQNLDTQSKALAIKSAQAVNDYFKNPKSQLELNKLNMTPQQKQAALSDTIKSVSTPQQQYTPEFHINDKGEIETTLKPKQDSSMTTGVSYIGDIGNMTPEQAQDKMKQVNPAYANYLKSLSDGKYNLSGRSTKQIAQIQKDLSNLYPGTDMAKINARYSTRKDFTTGNSAKNIRSLNTAVGHLQEFNKLIPQLHNTGFKMWNRAGQTLSREFGGNPRKIYCCKNSIDGRTC